MLSIKLKYKLLLLWLGSIFLCLLLVGGLFSYLSTRFHTLNARDYMIESFMLLRSELSNMKEQLAQNAILFEQREDVIASMSLISTYQDINHYQPIIFDVEKDKLSLALRRQLEVANLELGVLYDTQLRLNSFCWLSQQKRVCGYQSYDTQAQTQLISTSSQAAVLTIPDILNNARLTQAADALNIQIYASAENDLLMMLNMPLMRKLSNGQEQLVGFLQFAKRLDQQFMQKLLTHKESQFAFWIEGQTQHIDFSESELAHYFKYAPPLMEVYFKHNQQWWQSDQLYFLGVTSFTLNDGRRVLFALTLDKSALYTQISVMQQAVLVMLLIAAFLLIPSGMILLKHVVSDPIEKLVDGVAALTAGQYLILQHENQHDELGSLALSFNQMTATLRQREEHLRKLSQAVEQSPVSILITNRDGIIEYVNPKFVAITGYAQAEVIGQNPNILKSGYIAEETYHTLWQTIVEGKEWQGEFHNRKKNGEFFWESVLISPIKDNSGNITHFLGIKEDITVRKQYEEKLLHQANFDHLTDLPNRILAFDRLVQALASARRQRQLVAVLFLDLDQFKRVNDTLGHGVGDELLIEVGKRLQACIGEGDTLARLGGDEFLVILSCLMHLPQAEVIAQKLIMTLSAPFLLENREIFISASIGITVFPNDADDPHTLLRNADAAMYKAKESGCNNYQFFTTAMNESALKRLELESELRYALERHELSVYYQPQMLLRNHHLIGAEALLRWHSEKFGDISPAQFIPIAETTGLIETIGAWVLHTACKQAKQWQTELRISLRVAVNVSPYQFKSGRLLEVVSQALEESGLMPNCLELELTESLLMENAEETCATLKQLKQLGVSLALDDFGTGYSSLSYLKYFPFDLLKIDRAFIKDLAFKNEDASLTAAIIMMAHSLGLTVVAEGVENQEQLAFLHVQGCDLVQGYYVSKPLSVDKFVQFLHVRRQTEMGIRL